MEIHFKIATPAAIETLIPMAREFYAVDQHAFDEQTIRRALQEFLADHRWGLAWLIRADGQTAGYGVLTFGFSLESGGRDAIIDEIFVWEDFRGRGLGRQMIEHMIVVCRQEGIQALHLEVEAHNERAKMLYERLGFVSDNSTFMSRRIE